MFALTRGEVAIVAFIFALVWGARFLPQLGEYLGARLYGRLGSTRSGTKAPSMPDKSAPHRG